MFLGIRYFPIYSCKPNCITVKSFAFHIFKKHIMNNKDEWLIHWCSGNYPRFHLPAGIHPQFWIWCPKGRGISSASNRKFPRHLRAEDRGRWWILIFKGWKKGLVASETIKKKKPTGVEIMRANECIAGSTSSMLSQYLHVAVQSAS